MRWYTLKQFLIAREYAQAADLLRGEEAPDRTLKAACMEIAKLNVGDSTYAEQAQESARLEGIYSARLAAAAPQTANQ